MLYVVNAACLCVRYSVDINVSLNSPSLAFPPSLAPPPLAFPPSLAPPPLAPPPGVVYLDHAGATLYAQSQLQAHLTDLTTHLYGNPHSQNPSSQLTTSAVEHTREIVLRHFGTDSDHYDVIFTSGCTGALRLLSESFPWQRGFNGLGESQLGHGLTHRGEEEGGGRLESPTAVDGESEAERDEASSLPAPQSQETALSPIPRSQEAEKMMSSKEGHLSSSSELGQVRTEMFYTPHMRTSASSSSASSSISSASLTNGSSIFCYLEDNHTSVVGMREVATQFGASIVCTTEEDIVSLSQTESTAQEPTVNQSNGLTPEKENHNHTQPSPPLTESTSSHSDHQNSGPYHLFAFPAQSNFSGQKYPLSWVVDIQRGMLSLPLPPLGRSGSWKVVLDAASLVATNPLDLSQYPVDFVTISFYKMFGYPTGLGALLVRRDCSHLLRKRYYGGGTVLATVSRAGLHIPRPALHER